MALLFTNKYKHHLVYLQKTTQIILKELTKIWRIHILHFRIYPGHGTLIMFALILFRFYVHAFKTKVYTGSTVISVEVYNAEIIFLFNTKVQLIR